MRESRRRQRKGRDREAGQYRLRLALSCFHVELPVHPVSGTRDDRNWQAERCRRLQHTLVLIKITREISGSVNRVVWYFVIFMPGFVEMPVKSARHAQAVGRNRS